MRAVQGKNYHVEDGDRLWRIALDAYGDNWKYSLIVNANPQLNGRGLADDGSPLIFGGDVLWVPVLQDSNFEDVSFANQQRDSFSLEINGELVAVESGELLITLDTGIDRADAVIDISSVSETIRKALLPFKYPDCKVRINGELMLSGCVYVVQPELSEKKKQKKITIYSYTADLFDSCCNPPYTQTGVSLKDRAYSLCRAIGLTPQFDTGISAFYDKLTSSDGEKRGEHLLKIAKMRGILLSCTAQGNPFFTKAIESGISVDSISEGEAGALEFSAEYDGRKRYSSYRIVSKAVKGEQPTTKTVIDSHVPRPRFFSRKESSADDGGVEDSADWERSKAVSYALSMSIPVDRWRDRSGKLWKPNTFIHVESKTLDIPQGVDLLIRRVSFKFETTGKTATLDVVPHQVFSGKEIPDIWE